MRFRPQLAVLGVGLLALGGGALAQVVTLPAPVSRPTALSAGRVTAKKPPVPSAPGTPPSCPTPDLARCQEDGYGSSYCGAVTHRARCTTLVSEQAEREKALPEWSLLPSARWTPPGKRVRGQPATYDDFDVKGMTNLAIGEQQKTRLSALRSAQTIVKGLWHANGIKVESCSEYAHEKFWDYSNLDDQNAGKLEPRAYFDAVTRGMATLPTPKAKDGSAFAFGWPSGLPRNRYYQPISTYYPPRTTTRYAIRAAVLAWIDARGRTDAATRDLAWHRTMATALSTENDDTLDRMQARQLEFDDLLDRRSAVEARFTHPPVGAPAPTTDESNQAARVLAALDGEIEAYLIQAKADGCLDYGRVTRCDWAPRQFVEAFSGGLATRKQEAFATCMRVVGKAWAPTDPIMTTVVPGPPSCRDCTQGTAKVEAFMAQTQRTASAVRVKTAPDGKRSLGDVDGDDTHWGNKWIGAGYDYDFGWEAKNLSGPGTRECDVGLHAWGGASAHVNMLKSAPFKIVEARADLRADATRWNGTVTTRLLGIDWYSKSDSVTVNIVSGDEWQKQRSIAKVTIPVLGIPVKVEAGVAGSIGYEAAVGAGAMTRSCGDPSKTGIAGMLRFEPYTRLSGYLEAGVDYEIAEAGVAVDVTILRKSLPFRASLGAAPVTGGGLALIADTRFDFKVSTLDGHVYLYVDYTADEYRKTLFRWPGSSTSTNIWHTPLNAPMAQLR